MTHSLLSRNIDTATAVFNSLKNLEPAVTAAASRLASALRSGNKLLACGNGGSAADAAHLTTEFVCRFRHDRPPYPAICLAAHGGDLTAIGNDYSFADVFARQVHAFGAPGDLLFAFTTSGNSKNIVRALKAAKEIGVVSVAFLGGDGGSCSRQADIEFIVPSKDTARIQEAHQLLLHTICELAEPRLATTAPDMNK